jgi:hypothetical protein
MLLFVLSSLDNVFIRYFIFYNLFKMFTYSRVHKRPTNAVHRITLQKHKPVLGITVMWVDTLFIYETERGKANKVH